MEPSNWT